MSDKESLMNEKQKRTELLKKLEQVKKQAKIDKRDFLVKKLEYYKNIRRLEVAEWLKIAIALGDLSENSEYDYAKNEQAFLEGEIMNLMHEIRELEHEIHQSES